MKPAWFKTRGYSHFDAQVGEKFALSITPAVIEKHSWSPLISYIKSVKRYKPLAGQTVYKDRLIMYPSHRDACFLSKYSADLTALLDEKYKTTGLDESVIAYRSLGKSNYHFSADAFRFARENTPCVVLCFDVTGFFDNLDHRILKARLKDILGVEELPADWYLIFRHVTKFHHVDRDTLKSHPVFGPRLKKRSRAPFATIKNIVSAKIPISSNNNKFGIPQGTPISSAFSNLYLIALDETIAALCKKAGALYQRYSDDILIVCKAEAESIVVKSLGDQMAVHRLKINSAKTERIMFDPSSPKGFQYLGFNISPAGAVIRPGSLARQWRKAKRSIARTKKMGSAAVAAGKSSKIYTRKLRRRFSPVGARNFSSYARRSAKSSSGQGRLPESFHFAETDVILVAVRARSVHKVGYGHNSDWAAA
jgi:hypothetical protein